MSAPEAMAESGGKSLLKSKTFWIAFGLAAGIDVLNGFSYLWPVIPNIPVRGLTIHQYFTSKPWNAIGGTRVTPYPFAIGLAFFLPLDLSFSCWFFYVFSKILRVVGSLAGWQTLPRFPYFDEQGSGAWIGLCIVAFWMSRGHLKSVLKSCFGQVSEAEDAQEPMHYRTAVFGIIVGTLFVFFIMLEGGHVVVGDFLLLRDLLRPCDCHHAYAGRGWFYA